jgi:hypothetical protein
MGFVRLPGGCGRVYLPEPSPGKAKKHPCRDCYDCQGCTDARCALCRRTGAEEKAAPGKPDAPDRGASATD